MLIEWKGTPPAKGDTPMELAPAPAVAREDVRDAAALAWMKANCTLAEAAGIEPAVLAAAKKEERGARFERR